MPPTDYPTGILFKPTEQLQVMGLSPAEITTFRNAVKYKQLSDYGTKVTSTGSCRTLTTSNHLGSFQLQKIDQQRVEKVFFLQQWEKLRLKEKPIYDRRSGFRMEPNLQPLSCWDLFYKHALV